MRAVVRGELAKQRGSRLAVVVATRPHTADDDGNNYEVDVRLKHEDLELRRVPVAVSHLGFAASPRTGDLVLVEFVDGDLAQPLIVGTFYHAASRPPLFADGEVVIEHRLPDGTRNELRFSMDGTVRITVKDKVTLTVSEDGIELVGNVTIRGDLRVESSGGATTISGHEITGE